MTDRTETIFLPPPGLASPSGSAGTTRLLDLPSPAQRGRYALAYWPAALLSLLVPHRLEPTAARWTYAARFQPRHDDHDRWCETFGLDARATTGAPFLFCQATGTLLYMRLFADLGLNLRYLLHLRHRATKTTAPASQALAGQTVSARVAAVYRLGSRKAVVQVASTVSNDEGLVLLHMQDDFIVRGFRPARLEALEQHPAPPFEALQRPKPRWAAGSAPWHALFEVAPDLGRRYGDLSGDANPVHTRHWAARLFGHAEPFLQGLATRTLIVGHLAQAGAHIDRLDLHLCRPVPCGARLGLSHDGQRFELSDAQGARLLACGRFEAPLR
jgi:acyl dehydratase